MNILFVPLITLISTFIFQVIIIFIFNYLKYRKKSKELTPEEECKKNIRFIIKILVALAISLILSIVSYFGGVMYTFYELRKGH